MSEQQIPQQKISKNDKSVHANISVYCDSNGNLDIKKFISSVDSEVQQQNKEKARQMMIEYNKKVDAERAERNKKKQIPVLRPAVDLNRTILQKVNNKAEQQCGQLKIIIKESKEVDRNDKVIKKTFKPTKTYQQIAAEIDQMSKDEIMIKLFHFDQMESVNK